MGQYSKMIAAIVGFGALLLKQHYQIDLGDDTVGKIVDVIIAITTAFGVFAVPNTSKE